MKVTVTEPETGKKQIEVEVPVERVKDALEKAYGEYRKKVELPGFRKGKAPLHMIKGRYSQAVEPEAINNLVSETYQEVQQKHGINPAGAAQIEAIDYDHGQPLKYKAVVEVMPEITLKAYSGIDIEKEIPRVSEADVDMTLESLRDHYAVIASVDTAAEVGHFIVADIQSVDRGGVPIIGDKVENVDFQLGKSGFGSEFDDQLVGMMRDEYKKVEMVYPRDHPDPNLAGSERFFSVQIKEIKEKILPELNDELARTVAGLDSLVNLREEIKKDLIRRAEASAEAKMKNQIGDHLTKENPFPIPEVLVTRFLDSFVEDIKGKSQEPFDEGLLRDRYRPYAVNQIRLHLILEEIAQRENIEGGDDKVMAFLLSKANIKEVEPIRKEDHPSLIVDR